MSTDTERRLQAAGWVRAFSLLTAGPEADDDDGIRWRSPADRIYTEAEAIKRLEWDSRPKEAS